MSSKASDTPGNFIRRSPRSANIARCAWCSDCDVRRSPRSVYRRYSPDFAKCVRSRDILRSSLRIARKFKQSGRAILSHDFSNAPRWSPGTRLECHVTAIGEKKSPGVTASIGGENRWRFLLPIKFAAIGV